MTRLSISLMLVLLLASSMALAVERNVLAEEFTGTW